MKNYQTITFQTEAGTFDFIELGNPLYEASLGLWRSVEFAVCERVFDDEYRGED